MFLPPILIPACNSSSLAFLMMSSAYRLNKQGDSRQLCHTHFSILNQSVVPYRVLTCFLTHIQVSQETGLVFPSVQVFSIVCCNLKGFSIVSETEVDVFFFFLEFSCFFYNPTNVGNLISHSSAFSKPSLCIWKFSIHEMLKPSLKDFEDNLISM